jgi:non-ribosomal peptide synthetase component F
LPKGSGERIAALSRSEGVTVYMTLLAAFAALLWRQTGQEEVVVGSPIFGRDRVETEGLIGFFINTIVLRIDLRGNPSFRELLMRVRETALGAYAHQDVPLERLVDALKVERSLSHNPLFQVWFVLQNAGGASPKLEGLSVEEIPLETEAIRHDLQLSMSEAPAGLAGEFDYATDIFDASTVARLGESFERLLLRVLANPGLSLEDLRGSLDGDVRRHQRERRDALEKESRERLKDVRRRVLRG